MISRLARGVFLFALPFAPITPAWAQQCPLIYSQPQGCHIGSCEETYPNFYCQGYGATSESCGCEYQQPCCSGGVQLLLRPLELNACTDPPCVCNPPGKNVKTSTRMASTSTTKPALKRGVAGASSSKASRPSTDRRGPAPAGATTTTTNDSEQ
jgi:hypothetical protein